MVAGEASSDLLASEVLRRLAAGAGRSQGQGEGQGPGQALACAGIGGHRMTAAGFQAWWPAERLSIHGYADALRALPALLWIRHRLAQRLLKWRASVFVGIDAPDFNLGLEQRLRERGVRTVHFVSPSIWAWRPERIGKIRRAVDHMLLIFPFEQAIYRDAGIRATFVGHPLADTIPLEPDREAARAALGLEAVPGAVIAAPGAVIAMPGPVIALLPGSRRGEIERLAPLFLDVAIEVRRSRPDACFIVPAANADRLAELEQHLARARQHDPDLDVRLVDGQSHRVLEAADAVLVASGTATLEAALYKRPMVIAYRVPDFDYRRMKGKALQPWVGLPNILCGDFVVPEFIQDEARPAPIAASLLAALDDRPAAERLAARFTELHRSLRHDCAARVAAVLADECRQGGSRQNESRQDESRPDGGLS